MQIIKNPRKHDDKGLSRKAGTKNIRMRFADGIKVDESTKTPCWDKAQIVITNKRREVAEQKVFGTRPTISFDDAWELYVERNQKFWKCKHYRNEKNCFDRMMGRSYIRKSLPTKKHPDRVARKWSGISVTCPTKITANVLDELYTTRCDEGCAISNANTEIAFIRRLVKCLHAAEKKAPAIDSIKIRLRKANSKRLRIPLASEINELCSFMPEHHAHYVRSVALSGSRSQEIASARFSSIEWEGGRMIKIWLKDAKNDQMYEEPLIDAQGQTNGLGKIIAERFEKRNESYDWVFPMPNDPSRHRDHSLEYWYRAMEKTQINSEEVRNLVVNNREFMSPHHHRHFVGANLAAKGYKNAIIKKQLNQKDDRSVQIYIDRVENPFGVETMDVIDNILSEVKESDA